MIEQLAVELEPTSLFQDSAILTYRTGKSESMQNAHRIRPHQYGRSHLQQGWRLLKDFGLESEPPECQCRRQAANATADNRDSHQVYSRSDHFSSSFLP